MKRGLKSDGENQHLVSQENRGGRYPHGDAGTSHAEAEEGSSQLKGVSH